MSLNGPTDFTPRTASIQPTSFLKSLLKIWRPPVPKHGLLGPLKLGRSHYLIDDQVNMLKIRSAGRQRRRRLNGLGVPMPSDATGG